MKKLLSLIFSCFISLIFYAQQTEDAVIELNASTDVNAPSVTLAWSVKNNPTELLLIRRERGAPDWFILLDTTGQLPVTMTDQFVDKGKTYEYGMVQTAGAVTSFGYLSVPIETPLTEARGTVLIFVEEALQMPLEIEMNRLEHDLVGDGWKVIWHPVETDATVTTVKAQIVADYNANPDQVKSVLLLGEIPVPYSGNTAWDGHGDHQGAWPADTYYGDVDGVWQDVSVNNTTPSRAANDNVPGDGKFDHSIAPSATELAVGRVDFSNLSETTFGATRTELMRRYLNKNHNWRNHLYIAEKKALVDDNFGYFGGEAFAANGYRNFYPLVGVDNVVDGDFFTDTDDQNFLFGYGCGGGSYTSAGGVGNSAQFATDSVNIVFSMIFGSYHGDWDFENNPFMMSALASKGGILSCSWVGRPHWFYHPFAAGETLGYCTVETQNTCDNPGYFGSFGSCGAHVTLLGDPTLRAHVVDPVSDLLADARCSSVNLNWSASSTLDILGYFVYRSDALNGDFERLTPSPISVENFTDDDPMTGTNYYQVRAIVMQETESGFYENASTGVFVNIDFQQGTPPSLLANDTTLSCASPSVELLATTDAAQPEFTWTSPNGNMITAPTIVANTPGTYTVTVIDLATDCTNSTTVEVTLDDDLPSATPTAPLELNCTNTAVQLFANPSTGGLAFAWAGPSGFSTTTENPIVAEPGVYELTVSASNGCSSVFSVVVSEDFELPVIDIAPADVLNCTAFATTLSATVATNGAAYTAQWTTSNGLIIMGANTLTPTIADCGVYELTVVNNLNGCSTTSSVEVMCDFETPNLSVSGDTHLPCFGGETELHAMSTTPGVAFEWQGQADPSNPVQTVTAGTYTVVATGENGCTVSDSVTVTSETAIISNLIWTIDCDGFVFSVFDVMGGVPPYSVMVIPDGPIPPNTTYEATITDANGCEESIMGITPDFEPLAVEISHTNETVWGLNDGTATASPSFGAPPYAYNWSNGEMTQTVTDLAPGVYSVTITGANGCEVTGEVEILPGVNTVGEIDGLVFLEISPNPSAGPVSVALSLESAEHATLIIYDVAGRQLLERSTAAAFDHIWQLDMSGQAAGVYFCKITVKDGVVVRRFVLE